MHDVVLDHLKVGDEVVWLPEGKSVSLHTLDIGRVQRTLHHVDASNQEALLAIVDFVDRLEGSQEVRDSRGTRSFRLRVYAKHLMKLGDFLESVNSRGIPSSRNFQDPNNNGRGSTKSMPGSINFNPINPVQSVNTRSYVMRPCVLSNKHRATHPLISESAQIYVVSNNAVLPGLVKRLFVGDGNFYIGAEFGGVPVYPKQLAHSPSCAFTSNGCESRIGIQINNLTKHVWDTEFRLIVNGTKQITFEDLFYKEEPPPSYFTAVKTSTSTPFSQPPFLQPLQNQTLVPNSTNSNLPSAPPLTPSPPPINLPSQQGQINMNWEKFSPISPPVDSSSINKEPHFQPQIQPSGSQPLSKNYSASMMNLDSCGAVVPTRTQKPAINTTRPNSGLVDELKQKLKIKPTTNLQSENDNPHSSQNLQPYQTETGPISTENEQKRVPIMPEGNSLMEELKRRQQNKNATSPRPASVDAIKSKQIDDVDHQAKKQNRSSLPPPKPTKGVYNNRPNSALPFPTVPNGLRPNNGKYNPPAGSGTNMGGMTRASSCMNISISDFKPPTTPKPLIATKPAPKTVRGNPFALPKPDLTQKQTLPEAVNPRPQSLPIIPKEPEKIPEIKKSESKFPAIPDTEDPELSPPPPLPSRSSKPALPKVPQDLAVTAKIMDLPPISPPQRPASLPPQIQNLPPIKSNLYPDLKSESFSSPSHETSRYLPKISPPPLPQSVAPPATPRSSHCYEPEESQLPPQPSSITKNPAINQPEPQTTTTRNSIISRDNLPPPPPPPPPPAFIAEISQDQDFNEDDIADFPPPPPEDANKLEHNDKKIDLLQQIRQGIKLKPVVDSGDEGDGQHFNNKSTGIENMINTAITSRRVMLDSDDDEEDNSSDYDEDSDAWD